MSGICNNNVALAVVNGDDDEKKVNLIRMVTMMRKKKILLEWCAGPQDSPHCAYIAQARTHRGYGVCIGYIHCSQKLTQGHYQGSRNWHPGWEEVETERGNGRKILPTRAIIVFLYQKQFFFLQKMRFGRKGKRGRGQDGTIFGALDVGSAFSFKHIAHRIISHLP